MPSLMLGVIDVPYSWGQKKGGGISAAKALAMAKKVAGGTAAPPTSGAGATTYSVAMILEHKYHLFETFVAMRRQKIGEALEKSIEGAVGTVLLGGPTGWQRAFAQATDDIEAMFKDALTMQAFDGKIPGVPTKAAMMGVRHGFKRAYVNRGPRPSFVDTGLLRGSLKVWVE